VQPVLHFPNTVPQSRQRELKAAAIDALNKDVVPAYRKLHEFMRTEYAPAGREDPGIWSVPDGDAGYRFAIREMTTTNLSPDEIHSMGLWLVEQLEKEMLAIARTKG